MMAFWSGGAFLPVVACKTTCGSWQFGTVMPVRAGLSPVSSADRVGEHNGLAEYARVKVIPRFASRSTFGVW
jgi:hypothetical protein